MGKDGACPYSWPMGDRHVLVFFSHVTGSQYLIGDYDTEKFVVDGHGRFTFGPVFPGGIHAPTAFPGFRSSPEAGRRKSGPSTAGR